MIPKVGDKNLCWLETAKKELGIHEFKDGESARILEYHAATELKSTKDEVSWCSAFMCWVMKQCGIESTHSAAARSWLGWGIPIEYPIVGAIVVFKRGTEPWQGHVAIVIKDLGDDLEVIGGNQRDSVSIAKFSKSDVLGYRWPCELS